MLTALAKNTMLDALPLYSLSLHTAYSATGASEVTGGSPAYVRKNVTLAAASGGSKALSSAPVFDVPAAATVRFVGFWGAGSPESFLGMVALGGSEQEIISVDLSTDTFTVLAHGFVDTDTIVFYNGTVPTGLTEGTTYYVRDKTTDTFKVAATSGGSAIDITAVPTGQCVVSKIVAEAFGSQGTQTISSGSISLNA